MKPFRTLLAALLTLEGGLAFAQQPPPVPGPPPEPAVNWATYYGSNGTETILATVADADGNVYVAGQTNSIAGMATPGSHQETFGGAGGDAFLAKFSVGGQRIWATYYGGYGYDRGMALALVPDGVYLAGLTGSGRGIATPAAFQATLDTANQNEGMFLARFTADGSRVWGTYLDGPGLDDAPRLASDPAGNLYLTGYTNSPGLATTGSHQAAPATPMAAPDAILMKFDANGQRLWATYYGGPNIDQGTAVAVDPAGNVYLGGTSFSEDAIATAGSHQATSGGNSDGFVACFTPAGQRVWASYYGGEGSETLYGLAYDGLGNLYLAGSTYSVAGIATPGSFKPALPSQGNLTTYGFLARLSTSGIRAWGTYYGDSLTLATSVAADTSGKVYLAGTTALASGVTLDSVDQDSLSGPNDAFVAAFDAQGRRLYASLMGGDGTEYAPQLSLAGTYLYMAGESRSLSGLATLGSYQPNSAGGPDGFIVNWNPYGLITATRPLVAQPLSAAPNPATTTLTLQSRSAEPIQLLAPDGRLVRTLPAAPGQTLTLDVAALPPGLYLLRQGPAHGRVVVRR